ncbi:hypothetical protein Nepgr_007985 [Nepenthes gracilis]|uniref:Uncharacterized protein n=1 Tax=Nepenthes gracilis TaxID=150966 RepID=A0AAD3S835_NEPGR|nr:hypothetical protein Nepgr_007985 [Nepenthes gracilis]
MSSTTVWRGLGHLKTDLGGEESCLQHLGPSAQDLELSLNIVRSHIVTGKNSNMAMCRGISDCSARPRTRATCPLQLRLIVTFLAPSIEAAITSNKILDIGRITPSTSDYHHGQ